ncbi:MAG: AAA domain-containing protein [Egibacteraceae bacterium]
MEYLLAQGPGGGTRSSRVPPGTGKTHTIANVLAHLLATGRRVLVTAHTERALKEIRGKLPADLRDPSIAVTGQGHDERAGLGHAVHKMSEYVDGYEPEEARQRQEALERDVAGLRRGQAEIETRLVQCRVDGTTEVVIGAYHGTIAQIVRQLAEQAPRYGWLEDDDVPPEPPIADAELGRLVKLFRRDNPAVGEARAGELGRRQQLSLEYGGKLRLKRDRASLTCSFPPNTEENCSVTGPVTTGTAAVDGCGSASQGVPPTKPGGGVGSLACNPLRCERISRSLEAVDG